MDFGSLISPTDMQLLATEMLVELDRAKLFFYEAHEQEYDEDDHAWSAFDPEPSFVTNVSAPQRKKLEGYDVTTFTAHTSPECSRLSCNSLAVTIPTNAHCLFDTFEEARKALESGAFNDSEPGPFRIIEVGLVILIGFHRSSRQFQLPRSLSPRLAHWLPGHGA